MGYQINLETKLIIKVENSNFISITIAFLGVLGTLFESYVSQVLLHYFEKYYQNGKLAVLLQVQSVSKKSSKNLTKFKTLFGDIWVPQIQVRAVGFDGIERQMSITRILLGVSAKYQIPDFMKELMGWIGSVSTYRVSLNIIGALTNFECSLMSVWRSVQYYAKTIPLKLHKNGTNEFESDATGVSTVGSGKRGSELKKVFQKKEDGKLHLVGIAIGKYKDVSNWRSALTEPLKAGIEKFKKVVLASDGDKSITETAKSIDPLKVKIQKDHWHVFHQLKYYLWQDKAPKATKNNIIGLVYKITKLLTGFTSQKRLEILEVVINTLRANGYIHTATYLQSSMDGFYTYETEGNKNVFTTKTERSMRTTNQRINVGVWSDGGSLNVAKIRLAYYYNGISPLNWKKKDKIEEIRAIKTKKQQKCKEK